MTETYPLVIFDLDGTLVETAGDLMNTLNHLLVREGLKPIALGNAREMIGDGARVMLERGFAANGIALEADRMDRLFADFLDHYGANIAVESHAFPGAVELVDRLAASGVRSAVCTNKVTAMSVRLLEELGIAERFTVIAGPETFGTRKPDPRHITETIRACASTPDRAVMIGDSKNDIVSARGAGIPVIAVDFGYTSIPVTELGPDRIVSHFDEIWDAIAAVAPGVLARS